MVRRDKEQEKPPGEAAAAPAAVGPPEATADLVDCPAEGHPLKVFICRARQEKNFERCEACPNRRESDKTSFCFLLTSRQTVRRVMPPGEMVRAPRSTRNIE